MKVGIVGLPNVGKSTLFNALTKSYGAEAGNFPFCTIDPNTGIVNVYDERLEKLSKVMHSQQIVPATVEFVDIAGLVKGASQGEGLGNKFLATIREVDAILQVVRIFEDTNVHHVDGSINPQRDIEVINAELIIADLETIEKRMGDVTKKARSGDKEAKAKLEVLEKLKPQLDTGKLALQVDVSKDGKNLLKDLNLLTMKPFIYAANVSENNLGMSEQDIRKHVGIHESDIPVIAICAKIESEKKENSDEERAEFVADLGLDHNPVDTLIKTCFTTLGLQYFFTAGEKESRAWTIKSGATAPEAAGRIHSDFQNKFIKAETVNWQDLVNAGGWVHARETGKVRMEGKEYIMQDGDVVVFKFGG